MNKIYHFFSEMFGTLKDIFSKNVWLILIIGSLVGGIVLYILSSGEKIAQYKDLRTTVVEQKKSDKEQHQKSIDVFKGELAPLIAEKNKERDDKLAELGVE